MLTSNPKAGAGTKRRAIATTTIPSTSRTAVITVALCCASLLLPGFMPSFAPTVVEATAVAAATSLAHGRNGRRAEAMTMMGGCDVVVEAKAATATLVIPSVEEDATTESTLVNVNATTDSDLAISAAAISTAAGMKRSNPVVQLTNYVKTSVITFKNGLGQMNTDHKRCKSIRSKQRDHAVSRNLKVPRGIKGLQSGGISYEEYDFLKKGIVDRQKLLCVSVVALFLPNYFVYYLWTFPDMMPTPFLKETDKTEVSRVRCHAVISTLLDVEKGARVAPWTAKLNPFGKKATDRAMVRLADLGTLAQELFEVNGACGPRGGRVVLERMHDQLYDADADIDKKTLKQKQMLTSKFLPKQITKGIAKAVATDPISKGGSPFGIGLFKHVENVALADEFIVDQNVEVQSLSSTLLEEACSARLIGGMGWSDDERREALGEWLSLTVAEPREAQRKQSEAVLHFHGNLARAALMGYHLVDGVRDARADSKLLASMYRGGAKK